MLIIARQAFLLAVVAFPCSVASTLRAQTVLGIGDDATVVGRGVLRLRLATSSTRYDSRYGGGAEGRSSVPLGFPLTFDSIGAAQLPSLLPVRAALRQITGLPSLELSLGRSVARVTATVQSFPLAVELGVTDRLSIGLLVPIVRTRSEVSFNANPLGREGNIGFNPALSNETLREQNNSLFAQLDAAASALAARIGECQATPNASGCAIVNQRGAAELARTASLTAGLRQVYGTGTFVPTVGSTADAAIRQNVQDLAATYTDVFGLRDSQNQPLITSAGPESARTLVGANDLNTILADSDVGFGIAPIQTIQRIGVGDIEVGAKFQLLGTLNERQRLSSPEGFHFRTAITGIARLGTGTPDLPQNIVDIGTGDGQNDVEARSQSDLVFGRRVWFSVVGRYGIQLADERVLRVTDRLTPLAEAFRQQLVSRNLGDYLEVELTPRFIVNDFFSVSAQYSFRRKEQDRHTGRFQTADASGNPIELDASILDAGTEQQESRAGAGIAYSTVLAHQRGRARYPIEIFLHHVQTISGSGAGVQKIKQQMLQLRLYRRVFGAR